MKIGSKTLKEAVALLIATFLVISTVAMADTSKPTLSSEKINTAFASPLMGETELKYYTSEEDLSYVIGVGGGTPPYYWASAIRLTQDEMMDYQSWNLTKVVVYLSCDTQPEVYADLVIYGEGTPTQPGKEIYRKDDLYFDATSRYEIDIDAPIPLSEHNEIWIAMWWTQTIEGPGIPYTDTGPAVDQKGDWVNIGSGWIELQQAGNPPLDYNWGMGGIIECEGSYTTLGITEPTGPIGVKTGIKNTGESTAENVTYELTVKGGILGLINKTITGTVTALDVNKEEPISTGLIFGLGRIDITITADADNADPVSKSYSGLVLGLFVLGIQ